MHSGPEVCKLTGCTYRQLDYWVRSGWISAASEGKGSGYAREFDDDVVAVITHVIELIEVGFVPQAAITIAKIMIETGQPVVHKSRRYTVWNPRAV